MDSVTLRKLQLAETAILSDVDKYCDEHDIKYSLYGGTALGAVRHGGFIPWDDDLDIVMKRDQFERFCAAWKQEPLDGYFLQNAETDITCGINHTKIRKNGTRFVCAGGDERGEHQGIWIDILIFDKVPDKKLQTLYVYLNLMRSFIYTRGFTINKSEAKWRQAAKKVLSLVPKSLCQKRMCQINRNLAKYKDKTEGYKWMSLSCMGILLRREKYPAEVANAYTKIFFEGSYFSIFKEYEKMLHCQYGDYMQLPPEEKRVCSHSPRLIQFGPEE